MPIQRYGVLRGKALAGKLAGKPGKKPHYQIHVRAAGVEHRIAVNVVSDQSPSELAFLLETEYHHPALNTIREVAEGFTPIPTSNPPHELALDFVRGNLLAIETMKVVPHNVPGPDNDLNEVFSLHLRHAIDRGADLFAFGAKWGPENNEPDEYFDFEPGNGIHDIHMNQGSPPPHKGDNGVWQDGALFMHFADENRWLAFFLAFQSQHPQTDARGDLIPGSPNLAQLLGEAPGVIVPAAAAEVRIVAALVNPAGDDVGMESVTLVNLQPQPVNLAGWKLVDGNNKQATLAGPVLAAGDAARITLTGLDVQLSNKGGTLSLLDSTGRKVHGVAYTKAQVAAQGWTVVF
jgi:uncharacterized protein YukJ